MVKSTGDADLGLENQGQVRNDLYTSNIGVESNTAGRAAMTLPQSLTIESYFLTMSFPQHCRGTLQVPFPPAPQEQVFVTCNSRPQVLHRNTSPFFISEQFAISFPSLCCESIFPELHPSGT
jgi:hypothetical protein